MSTTTTSPADAIREALLYWRDSLPTPPGAQALTDEVIEQAARGPESDAALREWLEKTEWVQKSAQPHELGKHRADVLRMRLDLYHARAVEAHVECQTVERERDSAILERNDARRDLERLTEELAAAKREAESLRRACDVFRADLEAARRDRRDRFIAAALAGISAHRPGPEVRPGESHDVAHARWAIATADAVMKMVGAA